MYKRQTIDHTSLSRRSTLPTPNRHLQHVVAHHANRWSLITFFPNVTYQVDFFFLLILSHSGFAVCGHHRSRRINIVFPPLSSCIKPLHLHLFSPSPLTRPVPPYIFHISPSCEFCSTALPQVQICASSSSPRLLVYWYELVLQVERRKLYLPRSVACTICSNVIHKCHTHRHQHWKSVTSPVFFFCLGPRTGASDENVFPPTTCLQKGQKWSGVSVEKQHFLFLFFLNEPIAGTLGHSYKMFHANIRRSDGVGPILRHILYTRYISPKVDNIPKQSTLR